jgi:high affinity Mn2+ porin
VRSLLSSCVAVLLFATIIILASARTASADFDYGSGDDTWFAHSQTLPWWLSAQGNFIFQWHPRFHADYSGPNSFEHASEQAASEVVTVYSGFQFDNSTDAVFDVESAGGSGLSQVLGLGGFTNVDAVRNPELSAAPYIARLWIHKMIDLGGDTIDTERNPLSIQAALPTRRLDFYLGKLDLVDFFDVNDVAGDSHMQFMNWTVVNNGAFDYAADTRGYTDGAVIEYDDRWWSLRFAEVLLSKRANGLNLQKNLNRAHSENFELEVRPALLHARNSTIRLLAFTNYANMGDYHQAIDLFLHHQTSTPEINAHPMQTSLKYGFGINAEQELTDAIRAYVRAGWNEGQHESWSYTEVDETVSFGGDMSGTLWDRARDKFGVAFVVNGLSRNHREYLSLGGLGFVLGDGRLTYGPEKIMESYYNLPLPFHRGLYAGLDVQYIDDPGYNRARGPVVVTSVRLHIEL